MEQERANDALALRLRETNAAIKVLSARQAACARAASVDNFELGQYAATLQRWQRETLHTASEELRVR